MPAQSDELADLARRYGLSCGAVEALAKALASGHGHAQWSHPDLGGMGQWISGGMLQIGDMFNHDLKARVAAAIDELARREPVSSSSNPVTERAFDWWPASLGRPALSGSQNAMRYACFPEARRLVVERGGRVTVYDTGRHRLTGVSQLQSRTRHLTFTGPEGPVSVDDLTEVNSEAG